MQNTLSTKITHNHYDFTYHDKQGEYVRYRCMHRRMGCKAMIKIHFSTLAITIVNELHSCAARIKTLDEVIDTKEEFIEKVLELSLEQRGMSAKQIWMKVDSLLNEKYCDKFKILLKPTKNSVINMIGNVRGSGSSKHLFEKINKDEYFYLSTNDRRRFLQIAFQYYIPNDPIQDKTRNLLIWSHPELLPMLRRMHIRILIDGTFSCVPSPFKQCVIVMMFDDETNLFIPIIYILSDSKHHWAYWHMLHFILVLTEFKFNPISVTTDFESSLFNAIKEQFPETMQIGCAFHFKQAIRRKLVSLQLSDMEIRKAMEPGVVDILCMKPKKNIAETLHTLKHIIILPGSEEKWQGFVIYFLRTWVNGNIPFEMCNYAGRNLTDEERHVNTNNALENFNRILNESFSSPHPNIFCFIDKIREISVSKLAEIRDIKEQGGKRAKR